MSEQIDYIIRLRPKPGVHPQQALQAALKTLLRRHGLRCTKATPIVPDAADANERPATESEASK